MVDDGVEFVSGGVVDSERGFDEGTEVGCFVFGVGFDDGC